MSLVPLIPGLEVFPVRSHDEYRAARRLHAKCYVDAGYVEENELSAEGVIDDAWVPVSDYYVAVDTENDSVVGTCRIINASVSGFPAFTGCEVLPETWETFADLDPTRCAEISALATTRDGIQNMAISAALYGTVFRECVLKDCAYMLAVMDNRLMRIMRRWFHFPFEPLGRTISYMGSPSTPVAMYLPRAIESYVDEYPEELRFFSGKIPFADLEDFAIDLRSVVPEHRATVVDLVAANDDVRTW